MWLRAALLEEIEDNVQALTKALDVATTEKEIVVAEARAEKLRPEGLLGW